MNIPPRSYVYLNRYCSERDFTKAGVNALTRAGLSLGFLREHLQGAFVVADDGKTLERFPSLENYTEDKCQFTIVVDISADDNTTHLKQIRDLWDDFRAGREPQINPKELQLEVMVCDGVEQNTWTRLINVEIRQVLAEKIFCFCLIQTE
ncbi:MAG: hypothetical protein WCP15_02765 [bacterium]